MSDVDVDMEGGEEGALKITLRPSFGEDLWDDLEYTLGLDPDFTGNFYHSAEAASTPNPGLTIDGLDAIGVPLSSREARTLIGYASASLNGPRVTSSFWTIKSDRVKFNNPTWNQFIQESVEKACTNLGVASWQQSIECHFSRLVILDAGQRDLPDRTFASLAVILPSSSTHGKLKLSFDSQSANLQLTEDSYTTNTFAWYTGVTSELQSEGSGYYLVLIYYLTHAENSPCPKVSSKTYAQRALTHIVQTWRSSKYQHAPPSQKLAILLKKKWNLHLSRYGPNTYLDSGDRTTVARWKEASSSLGYSLFLGKLEYHNYVNLNDSATSSVKTKITVQDLHELDSSTLDGSEVPLPASCVVPSTPFRDQIADSINCNKETGLVDQCFTGTILFVVGADEKMTVLKSAGVAYSLEKLRNLPSAPAVGNDKQMLALLLNRIRESTKDQRSVIMRLCIRWKKLDLWKGVIRESGSTVGFFGAKTILGGCKAFSFKSTQPTLDKMMKKTSSLKFRVDLIEAIFEARKSLEPVDRVETWCQLQYKATVGSATPLIAAHVPELIRIVVNTKNGGLLVTELLPHLQANPETVSLDTIHPLVAGLGAKLGPILSSHIKDFACQSLKLLLKQPKSKLYGKSKLRYVDWDSPSVDLIVKILEIAILSGDILLCTNPLCLLLHLRDSPGPNLWDSPYPYSYTSPSRIALELSTKLKDMGLLRTIEKTNSKQLDPIKPFFRSLIGVYFVHEFKTVEPGNAMEIDEFGCDKDECRYCEEVRKFLNKLDQPFHAYPTSPVGRKHLKPFLDQLADYVKYEVHYRPFELHLTKQPVLAKSQAWEAKVIQAKAFLKTIGTDEEIEAITGSLYPKITDALDGSQPFTTDENFCIAVGAMNDEFEIIPAAAPHPDTGDSSEEVVVVATGFKRRRSASGAHLDERPVARARVSNARNLLRASSPSELSYSDSD